MYVYMVPTFLKDYFTEFHEIFRDDLSSSKELIYKILGAIRSKVKVNATKRSKTDLPNCMKFSGIICHHPRTIRLDFGSDQAKGQGHEKVKNLFLS